MNESDTSNHPQRGEPARAVRALAGFGPDWKAVDISTTAIMQSHVESIQSFLALVEPFRKTWRAIEIRAAADLDTNTLLSLVACLTSEEPTDTELLDQTQGIHFIREGQPGADLDEFLRGWESGQLTVGGHRLSAAEFGEPRLHQLSPAGDDVQRAWPHLAGFQTIWLNSYAARNLEVMVHPKDLSSIARVFGERMFSDLTERLLRIRFGDGYSVRMNLFAPILVGISADVSPRRVEFTVTAHQELTYDQMRVRYRLEDYKGNRVASDTLDVGRLATTSVEPFSAFRGELELPDGTRGGDALLYYPPYTGGREPVASTRFVVPAMAGARNPRWDVALSIIGRTRKWTRPGSPPESAVKQWLGLTVANPDSKDFELGVAVLLFAAGAAPLSIGPADGVDLIVAQSEQSASALLVSCVTSADIGPKIAPLVEQRNNLQDRMPDMAVDAAICSPALPRDLRVGHVADCNAAHIRMLLKDDLSQLYDSATGRDWHAASEMLRRLLTS